MADTLHEEPEEPAARVDEETPLLGDNNGTAPANRSAQVSATGEETVIAEELSSWRLALTLGSIYVGVFLGALDTIVIATLSAPISTSFNSLSLLSWVASSYLIANAACQPISGRLTDIFSRRTGLVVSNILFGVGNLMCGLAHSEWTMIAGRVVAGMGGGCLMSISTFVASDLVPLRKRGFIQGVGNLCFGVGAGLGGLFGGWMNDAFGWRMAFLSQVPVIAVSGTLVFFLVDVPAKKSEKSKLSRVDFTGTFTLLTFLILLLLGLNSGGNIVPWNHPLIWTTLPLSGVALIAFIWWEARFAKEPVIPVKLLLDRTVAASCLTNWFGTASTFVLFFYIPIFFQLQGLSTIEAGLHLLPHSIGASTGSLGAGIWMNKTGKYRLLGMLSISLFVIGAGLNPTLSLTSPGWPAYIYLFLIGLGYGGMLTVTLLACIAAVDHQYQAVITSATYAFRSTGSTIGVTIASAVYQNLLSMKLWETFGHEEGAADEIKRIRDSFDELQHLPPGWGPGVMEAYSLALKGVFLTAFALAFLGMVSTAFLKQHVLHSNLARR